MRQFSVRQHVALLTLAPLLILTVSLESFFLHDRFADLDRGLIERGQLIARQLASSSEYGVFSNNRLYLKNVAQGVMQQPDMRGVVILNAASESMFEGGEFSSASGNVVAGANSALTERTDQSRLALTGNAGKMVSLLTPVRSSSERLWIYQPIIPEQVALDEPDARPGVQQSGAVIIEMSRVRIGQIKSQMLWWTIGGTLLFVTLLCGLIYLISRSITSPISKLSDAVQEIKNGKLETRVSMSSHVSEMSAMADGINDMATRLQQETALLHRRVEDATRIAALAFESHEGMMVTDANGVIIRVNDALTRITGYSFEELVGQTPKILKSGLQNAEYYSAMWDRINATGTWQGEIWNRRKSGEIYPVWGTITAVKKESGEPGYYVATHTDITSRKAAENEIHNLVYCDALTELPNRRMFANRLSKARAASKRSGRYNALMFLDMDNFKPLNDMHGHAAGDVLLTEVARRLVSCVREVDTVARFGGDEFVVMLSDLDTCKTESASQASIIAEKIRIILAEPYTLTINQDTGAPYTLKHSCSSSIGVVLFLGHEAAEEELINQADMAMYHAKESGRNAIRFYSSGVIH